MVRPLLKFRISDLEGMFRGMDTNRITLARLVHELKFRKTPRAIALLRKVRGVASGDVPELPLDTGCAIRSNSTEASGARPALPMPFVAAPSRSPGTIEPLPESVPSSSAEPDPPSQAPIAEACKLLKCSPASTWESVEWVRRQLVSRASPARTASMSADERIGLNELARRINAAYATLAEHRATQA